MARIRTIKPEFPQSESMGRVSRDARLLFILLWPICDDHGRTRAASRMLASTLFPYDDDAKSLIGGWLDELEREGCILRYEVGGSAYLQICNWLNHQKIDKPSKPQFPEPSEKAREDSRKLVLGREGKGEERKGEKESAMRPTEPEPGKAQAAKFDLPDWVSPDVWAGFEEMRNRIRKPMTVRAKGMILTELIKLRSAGNDPNAVLDQSTRNSWQDVFALRDRSHGRTNESPSPAASRRLA